MHPFRIYGHFPSDSDTRIDIGLLSNIFLIASEYFSKVIKVTSISPSLTRYPSRSGSCGVTVPDTFVTNGFNQEEMDMVVLIVLIKD